MKKAVPGTNSNKNNTMKTNIRDSTDIIKNVFSTLAPKKTPKKLHLRRSCFNDTKPTH